MPQLAIPHYQQTSETDCAIAIFEMICGLVDPGRDRRVHTERVLQAVAAANLAPDTRIDLGVGVAPRNIGDIAAHLGWDTVNHGYPDGHISLDLIGRYLADGRPVIAYIKPAPTSPLGHYILISGSGTAEGRGYLALEDPANPAGQNVWYDVFPRLYYRESEWIWAEAWAVHAR